MYKKATPYKIPTLRTAYIEYIERFEVPENVQKNIFQFNFKFNARPSAIKNM